MSVANRSILALRTGLRIILLGGSQNLAHLLVGLGRVWHSRSWLTVRVPVITTLMRRIPRLSVSLSIPMLISIRLWVAVSLIGIPFRSQVWPIRSCQC